jgi:PAT family beta-lactamase induction signal transducer AmpG
MTLLGAALGGLLIVRFGILPILLIGGAASAGTNLLFATLSGLGVVAEPAVYAQQTVNHLLAALDPHMLMLVLTITLDNLSSGLATAAFVAYLSSLTNLKFSATQYALLSSIMLLLPRLVGGYSGVMVEKVGYAQFFLATALLGIPTLLLIILQWRQQGRQPFPEPASATPRSEP